MTHKLTSPDRMNGTPQRPIATVAELVSARSAERIRLPVQVQARHPGDPYICVQFRVRLPGEHLHLLSQPGQLAAEVSDVDALTPAARIAAVRQQRDPHHPPPSAFLVGPA